MTSSRFICNSCNLINDFRYLNEFFRCSVADELLLRQVKEQGVLRDIRKNLDFVIQQEQQLVNYPTETENYFINMPSRHTLSHLLLELHTSQVFMGYYKQQNESIRSDPSSGFWTKAFKDLITLDKQAKNLPSNEMNDLKFTSMLINFMHFSKTNHYDFGLINPLTKQICHAVSRLPGVTDVTTTFRFTEHEMILNDGDFYLNVTPLSTSKGLPTVWSEFAKNSALKGDWKTFSQDIFSFDSRAFNPTAEVDFITDSGINEYELVVSPFTLFKKETGVTGYVRSTPFKTTHYRFAKKYFRRRECLSHAITEKMTQLKNVQHMYTKMKLLYRWHFLLCDSMDHRTMFKFKMGLPNESKTVQEINYDLLKRCYKDFVEKFDNKMLITCIRNFHQKKPGIVTDKDVDDLLNYKN